MPLLAFALFACEKKEAPKAQQMPPAPVVLAKTVQKDAYKFISTLGSTSSFESVNIVPQVTGQITSINFKQGDFVKKGQVLAEIDSRPYKARVKAAEATLLQAKAQLEIDKLEVSRNENLAKSNYVSKQTFDSLKAKVEVDNALVKAAEADLNLAKINLQWCSVKSPIDGKVGFFNCDAGNVANANTTLITTVENLSKLYVNFFISSDKQFEVQELMKANGGSLNIDVSYATPEGKTYKKTAKVEIVENRSRYESSTIVLRAVLDNADFMFWANQQVKVLLNTTLVKNAAFVPDSAISVDNVGSFVFVAKKVDDILYSIEKRKIVPVQLFPDGNYLIEGVKQDEMVVVKGQLRVAQGAFAYASIPQGAPIGADGKPIANPAQIKEFMGKAMQLQAKYMAEAKAKAQENAEASSNTKAPAKQESSAK